MTIDERLCAAVKTVIPVCRPSFFRRQSGKAIPEEYCTYTSYTIPSLPARSRPQAVIRRYMVNYVLAVGKDPEPVKRALCEAIAAAGFTYPSITDASDDELQNWAFEFEGVE